MALIHPQSCDCTKSELDLFSVPLTQTSVEQGRFIEVGPLSALDDGIIEFKINGSDAEYVDLANTFIIVKAKVVNGATGAAIANDANVAPVNLFLHSLFSQVDTTLGNTLVTSSNNTYPYRAYIETLLSYGQDAKLSQLTSSLWFKDTAGHMGAAAGNLGYQARKALAANSAEIEMVGKLHMDMLFQERYLLNGVDVHFKLVPNTSAFCLLAGGDDPNFKIKLTEVKILCRKVKLSAAVQIAHAKALQYSTVKYPIRRVECKSFAITRGLRSASEENLFSGQLPKRVVLGLVSNNAYNGSVATNPFDFQHFNVENIGLLVDGQQIYGKPLTPNFPQNEYIRSYWSLFTGTGMVCKDDGNGISRDEYKAGFTLFAYDLTPDLDEGGYSQLVKQGVISLSLKFRDALANAVNVIVYAEFENIIEIDQDRRVSCDYSA